MIPFHREPFSVHLLETGGTHDVTVCLLTFGDWLAPSLAPVLVGVIVLAVLGTMVLFAIGLAGYLQRQTTQYLVLTIALGALVARSIVGMGTVLGLVPMTSHHLIEHSSDVFIAAVLLSLLYWSRPTGTETERASSEGHDR
ncbi:DUF7471 family protein [Natronorubrum aibiense]|uniref:DUF7471 family protein n=1 Tax=Natronorubrum aibiense TaxID=348826 RepID=UPI001D04C3FA|nr:hypothetical protein [Natronorubrum aibiense]